MRQSRATEAIRGEPVLEHPEVGQTVDRDRHVRVVGHPGRPGLEEQLGNQAPTMANPKLAETSDQVVRPIDDDGDVLMLKVNKPNE